MDDRKKLLQDLLNEARGLLGMIAEIGCKIRLLEIKVESEDIQESEVDKYLDQMTAEANTYSKQLDDIFAELKVYGLEP